MTDLKDRLRSVAQAYPESVFPPLTDAERKSMGTHLDRASAAMGRHFSTLFTQTADAIETLERAEQESESQIRHYRDQCLKLEAERDKATELLRQTIDRVNFFTMNRDFRDRIAAFLGEKS